MKCFFCHLNTFSCLKQRDRKNPYETIVSFFPFTTKILGRMFYTHRVKFLIAMSLPIPLQIATPQHSTKIALSIVSISLNLWAIIQPLFLNLIASLNTVDDPLLKQDSCLHTKYPVSWGIHWDRWVSFLLCYFVTLSGVSTGRWVFTSETHSWGGTSLPRSQIKNDEMW